MAERYPGKLCRKKYWGIARIDPLINSPLFAMLQGVLRKCGTGSHAPDRQKNCSPPQRLLCANNGVEYCPFLLKRKARPES